MAKAISNINRIPGGVVIKMDVKGTFNVVNDLEEGHLDLQSIVLNSGEIIYSIIILNDITAILNSNGGSNELFIGATIYAIKVDEKKYFASAIIFPQEPDRVYLLDKMSWGPRIWASFPMLLFTLAAKICSLGIMSGPFDISVVSSKTKKIINYIQKMETDKNLVYLN